LVKWINTTVLAHSPDFILISKSTILAPFWHRFGTILAPFWHHFGIVSASFWHHFGTTLAPFWHQFGTILGLFYINTIDCITDT
jgi:hypothetical protein